MPPDGSPSPSGEGWEEGLYTMNPNYYCIILAGGIGMRLWPVSRQHKPKQFIDLLGTGETLLQSTYRRFSQFIPADNILVMTNHEWADTVREQLPQLPIQNVLSEPIRRNTVPPVFWGCVEVTRRNPNGVAVVAPSDQNITDLEPHQFEREILAGLHYAETTPRLLTLGVRPTRPEVAYGYIQMAERVTDNIYNVQSFTEKPEQQFSEMFYKSGEFLWNTGIFIWQANVLLQEMHGKSGDYSEMVWDARARYCAGSDVDAAVRECYSMLPNMTIEKTLFEHTTHVNVMQCHFGWADLGTWDSVYDYLPKDPHGNVQVNQSRALFYDCKDCVVRMPEGHVAVLQGLTEYVVVEQGNVLVVCRKEDQNAIRRFVTNAQIDLGEEYV